MSSASDFKIQNGVLVEYLGNDTDVVIPYGVTAIGNRAFSRSRDDLNSVVVPEGVESIRANAFSLCGNLTHIEFPEGLTRIDKEAFSYCKKLTEIKLPSSLRSIGANAFFGCKSLISIDIPEGISDLENGTFSLCTNLSDVSFPGTLSRIGNHAFYNCESLNAISVPDSVSNIGEAAFHGCNGLADSDGFIIFRDVLYGYCGAADKIVIPSNVKKISNFAFSVNLAFSLGYCSGSQMSSVVIPEAVISIGASAFCNCTNLSCINLPEGLKTIGSSAFENCRSLQTIEFPESIIQIDDNAFDGCCKLTSIVLPKSIEHFGKELFRGCTALENAVFQKGITKIEESIFANCENLSHIDIPMGVTSIGRNAFASCHKLKNVTLPYGLNTIGEQAFSSCSLTSIVIPSTVIKIGSRAFEWCFDLRQVEFAGEPPKLGKEAFNCKAPIFKAELYHTDKRLSDVFSGYAPKDDMLALAYIHLYQSGKSWTTLVDNAAKSHAEAIMSEILGILKSGAKISSKAAANAVEFVMKRPDTLKASQIQELYQLLTLKKCTKALEKFNADARLVKIAASGDEQHAKSENPLEKLVQDNWVYNDYIKKLQALVKLGVKYKDSEEVSSPNLFVFILNAYKDDRLARHELADKVAAGLNQSDLILALEDLFYRKDFVNAVYALAKYSNASAITRLIREVKVSHLEGRYQRETAVKNSIYLSSTKEAVLYLSKNGSLCKYSGMHGIDEDVLRDTVLVEFGLDEQGHKSYDLGNTTVVVSLNSDLSLSLFDSVANKVVKSIPKRGAVSELYEAANADFSVLKKDIKKAVKSRNDALFKDFLSGRERDAKSWVTSFTKNPLLHQIAQLLVWSQGKDTFTLTSDAAIDCTGAAYKINENVPIKVAHPIEMSKAALEAWQKYFTSHGLKQPFAQIWEPVINPEAIKEDRYKGCMIPYFRFRGQEKHGIVVEDYNFHDEVYITFDDCDADVERIDWKRHSIDNNDRFEIKSFKFREFNRQVNHIAAYLDKVAVYDRILKDDSSTVDILDCFTLAQLTEFIDLAIKNNCTNCLAILLDYKSKKFVQYDPMDIFTLE